MLIWYFGDAIKKSKIQKSRNSELFVFDEQHSDGSFWNNPVDRRAFLKRGGIAGISLAIAGTSYATNQIGVSVGETKTKKKSYVMKKTGTFNHKPSSTEIHEWQQQNFPMPELPEEGNRGNWSVPQVDPIVTKNPLVSSKWSGPDLQEGTPSSDSSGSWKVDFKWKCDEEFFYDDGDPGGDEEGD